MILRRIAEAIRKMDWVVVTIELLVVIVGIYLGLQVDEWSKERDKRADIDQQLERILTDAQFIQQNLGDIINSIDADLRRFEFALNVLNGQNPENQDELSRFEFAIVDSYRMDEVDVVIPGLELLIESGDIRAVGNAELEKSLIEFVNYRRRQSNVVDHVRVAFRDQATAIMSHTSHSLERLVPDKPWGAETSLDYDLAELRNSAQFRRAMGNLLRLHVYLRMRLLGYKDRIDTVVSALENRQPLS